MLGLLDLWFPLEDELSMSSKLPKRLIPIKVEPPSALTPAEHTAVLDVCTGLKSAPGALMPILHAVQAALGYVPKDSVPLIARELNLSLAEVHGVLTFYHYFRKEPAGRHVVHLCRAEACQAVGAVELESHAKRSLGVGFHETTADGSVTLEPVYCLGNCALGPSLMIDDQLKGRVSAQRFDELMREMRDRALRLA
jgi:formate dehydrogenase subunit gamma